MSTEIDRDSEEECFGHIIKIEMSLGVVLLELLECICIGISHNELGLCVKQSQGQLLDFWTVLSNFHVW